MARIEIVEGMTSLALLVSQVRFPGAGRAAAAAIGKVGGAGTAMAKPARARVIRYESDIESKSA